jgi:hypothetical protein
MDESAQGVGTDHSEQPEDQEQSNNSPKHRRFIPFRQPAIVR